MTGLQHTEQPEARPIGAATADEPAPAATFSFQVARSDVTALLAGLRITNSDERSPLAKLIEQAKAGRGTGAKPDIAAMIGNPNVARTIVILSRPALIAENRVGGGAQPLGFFSSCHAPAIDAQAFATILPSAADSLLFILHPSPWHFLAWWLDRHASQASETAANHLPPPLSLDSTLYALHAIDLYRRCAYESLLAHSTADTPAVTAAAFLDSMHRSIASRDLRWLLPAFIALTPGLDAANLGEGAEPSAKLAMLDIMFAAKGREGASLLVFGEAGRRLGVEFYHSWFQAAGFRFTVRADSGWTAMCQGFLAPTGLANHLFLMNVSGNTLSINHQALTRELLDRKLAGMMRAALAHVVGSAP
jgi:hypothetical protein